jgi:hypothetical protein
VNGGPPIAGLDAAVLGRRVNAIKAVTEMASDQVDKLLGHARQLQDDLDGLAGQTSTLPDQARVKLLAERMDSLQAMLDWLTTSPGGKEYSATATQVQTGLAAARVSLVNMQGRIRQVTGMARRLAEIREMAAELTRDLEALTPVKGKAVALLEEAVNLSRQLEMESTEPANGGASGPEPQP